MFTETKPQVRARAAQWLEDFAQRHPRAFAAALVVLMVVLTLSMLFNPASPIVLYQGF